MKQTKQIILILVVLQMIFCQDKSLRNDSVNPTTDNQGTVNTTTNNQSTLNNSNESNNQGTDTTTTTTTSTTAIENETQIYNYNNIIDEDSEQSKEEKCFTKQINQCLESSLQQVCFQKLAEQMKCFELNCTSEKLGTTAKSHAEFCYNNICISENYDVRNANKELYSCLSASKLFAFGAALLSLIFII